MLDEQQLKAVALKVLPILDVVAATYDFAKYPAEPYHEFRKAFSSLAPSNPAISLALQWKWGHWRKKNFPARHRALIDRVAGHWVEFVASAQSRSSQSTFEWWHERLGATAFISAAYITHLIHSKEPVPIIDQHNFRAMNALVGEVQQAHVGRRKPSKWSDIVDLTQFMSGVLRYLPAISFEKFDRFLMMYGRDRVPRGLGFR